MFARLLARGRGKPLNLLRQASRRHLSLEDCPPLPLILDRRSNASPAKGVYPVADGEVFKEKYSVTALLGSGTRSNIFLVENITNGEMEALKIHASFMTESRLPTQERDAMRCVSNAVSNLPPDNTNDGHDYVTRLTDDFVLTSESESGLEKHQCLVSKALGPNAQDISRSFGGSFPPAVHQRFCKHVLKALRFLHETCELVHTDIKTDNVYLSSNPLKEGATIAVDWPQLRLRSSFILGDFGEAVPGNVPQTHLIQSDALRAPEVVLGGNWGYKADIFNFAVIALELARGDHLFNPHHSFATSVGTKPQEAHLGQMISLMGEFPKPFLQRMKGAGEWFDLETGQLKPGKGSYGPLSIRDQLHFFRARPWWTEEQLDVLADFVEKGMALDPEERWDVGRMMGHEWVRGVMD